MAIDPTPLFDTSDDPATFNAARSFALGLLSAIAYQNNQIHVDRWGDLFGFDSSKTVVTPGLYLNNFAICKGGGRAVIALSGTEAPEQMFSNILHSAQAPSLGGIAGAIHSYFRWTAESIAPFIADELLDQPAGTQLVFTGHSLGGATAYLLGDIFAESGNFDVRRVVGFNSPKVGDTVFANATRAYRAENVCHQYDKVNRVPPPFSMQLETPAGIDWDGFIYWHPWPVVHEVHIPQGSGIASASSFPGLGIIYGMLDWGFRHGKILASANSAYAADWATARYPMPATRAVTQVRGVGIIGVLAGLLLLNLESHAIDVLLRGIRDLHFPGQQEFDISELLAETEAALAGMPHLHTPPTSPPAAPPVGTFLRADPVPPLPAPLPTIVPSAAGIATSWEYRAYPLQDAFAGIEETYILPEPAADLAAVEASFRERRHWFIRGQDRRILESLWECLEAIEDRDQLAESDHPSAAISTRQTMVSQADDATHEAFQAVKDQVNFLLGLFRG